jgi:SAM-dependent methyltransferase
MLPGMPDTTREFWDEIHRRPGHAHPGRPHPYVVQALADEDPGTALELGCGAGAAAIWLAERGWSVTGVDVSQVALDRAAEHAAQEGVGDRVRWERADLRTWTTQETFDLVLALFVHSPLELDSTAVLAQAAGRTRPGGTLLVVGHCTLAPWAWAPDAAHDLPTAAEQVSALGLHEPRWLVRRAAEVPRVVRSSSGEEATILDAVVHAQRGGGPAGA